MKLCDTCIYRSNVEQLKPCIIYRDDCEYYEREEDMKAIIRIDVPNYQIGQEVSIYFKDTMMIKGIVQEPKTGLGDILIADQCECANCIHEEMCKWKEERHGQECAYMQEPKTGHWTHDGSHWKNRFICSECGYKLFEEQTNYCPNCGAKMESEEV